MTFWPHSMMKLKPKQKHAKKIAKALKRGKKAKAKLKVKLFDGAGNRETEELRVKLELMATFYAWKEEPRTLRQ